VQYDKHGWRNRNRIKTPQGPQWLTVPVLTRGQEKPMNREVLIDTRTPWARKHVHALHQHYGKARAFREVFPRLEALLAQEWTRLLDLSLAGLHALCDLLGLKRDIRLSSELGTPGTRTERLVAICQALGADTYLSGDAARAYLDASQFARAGIRLEYHGYAHPIYTQLYGEYVPYLSVVDLLMNHGRESLDILVDRGGPGRARGHACEPS
jgi:hypothetical protein